MYAAITKSPGTSSRGSQEINDEIYIWLLLLLSLKQKYRKNVILRGGFAICGLSDDSYALLGGEAPRGKVYRYCKINHIFDDNLTMLSPNLRVGR